MEAGPVTSFAAAATGVSDEPERPFSSSLATAWRVSASRVPALVADSACCRNRSCTAIASSGSGSGSVSGSGAACGKLLKRFRTSRTGGGVPELRLASQAEVELRRCFRETESVTGIPAPPLSVPFPAPSPPLFFLQKQKPKKKTNETEVSSE